MRRLFRTVLRGVTRLIPARYTSWRDRLSPEDDQLVTSNQFRAGM